MKKFVYGLAEFSRIDGTIDSYIHLPVGEVSGHTVPAFLENAAEQGWELCGTMPGPSRIGANMATADGGRRKVEDYNEATTLIFKKEESGISKQQQFLWVVQTAILANGTNLASIPDKVNKYRVDVSASGALMVADEALRASELIPEEMSAFDAAHQFCTHMLRNLRDSEVEAKGTSYEIPYWFAR